MATDKSQAKQRPINFYDLMKVVPQISQHYKLANLDSGILMYFLTSLRGNTGNIVNLAEFRWDSRAVYCRELKVSNPSNITRSFRRLEAKGVFVSEEERGKKARRYLADGIIEYAEKLVENRGIVDKSDIKPDTGIKLDTGIKSDTGTRIKPDTPPVSNLIPRSNIEELTKGTNQSQLAGWEKEQPSIGNIALIDLAKRIERWFIRPSVYDYAENNRWVARQVEIGGLEGVQAFADWLWTHPQQSMSYSPENRRQMLAKYGERDKVKPEPEKPIEDPIPASGNIDPEQFKKQISQILDENHP